MTVLTPYLGYKEFLIFGLKTKNKNLLTCCSSGAQPEIMNTTTKKIINSFIIVPLVATTLSMNVFTISVNQSIKNSTDDQIVYSEKESLQQERENHAAKIDTYFAKYDLPLEGYGMKMVLAAEEHELPWNLLPSIAMRETTGGKFACKKNPFGWGSCKIGFKSFDEAIDTVAKHIGGNHASTAYYYKGKTLRGILESYNPPSVVPTYANEIISIMNSIDKISI